MAGKHELPFGSVKISAKWSLCFLSFCKFAVQKCKMSLSVLDVAGVVLQNFLAQVAAVQMHIDFCGANVFVAEHGLYGTEVGAPLQQMGGKAVAEGVGTDVLGDAGPLCVIFDEDKEADAA